MPRCGWLRCPQAASCGQALKTRLASLMVTLSPHRCPINASPGVMALAAASESAIMAPALGGSHADQAYYHFKDALCLMPSLLLLRQPLLRKTLARLRLGQHWLQVTQRTSSVSASSAHAFQGLSPCSMMSSIVYLFAPFTGAYLGSLRSQGMSEAGELS